MFFQIGLIIALSAVLAAFEWSTRISKNEIAYNFGGVDVETEMVPITRPEEIKPPPPKHYEKFEIVDDDEDIKPFEPTPTEVDPAEAVCIEESVIIDGCGDPDDENEPLFFTEKMPEFPGGFIGLRHYLAKNIRYPSQAAEANIQGKVYVRFVVDKEGFVRDARVLRGIDSILDVEALRVVKNMPKWKPGEQAGRPVSVWFTVPIVFVLE